MGQYIELKDPYHDTHYGNPPKSSNIFIYDVNKDYNRSYAQSNTSENLEQNIKDKYRRMMKIFRRR